MVKTFRLIAAIGLTMLLSSTASAQDTEQWIRYSAISPDGSKIAFTFKGNIYTVAANGGNATQLTYHKEHDFMPIWNNDGTKISFASNRYGDFDVFIVDAQGGEAKRLTYHSANEYPYAFSHDNTQVIFGGQRLDDANHRQYPTGSQPEVYTVAADGGRVNQLWTIPAELVRVSSDGKTMVYHDKKGGENEWRKHHTSSITRDIWAYDVENDQHKMITLFEGENRNPVFTNDNKSIFYLSEESGTFNVHKLALDNPKKVEQITSFEFHPVRFLSISHDETLCYTHHGNLYTQKLGAEPQRIEVKIKSGSLTNNEQILPIAGNISEMAIAPNGKEVAFIARGEVFVSSVEGKITKRITNTTEQEKFINFSPDGKSIIYASQRNTIWGIYKATKVVSEEPFFYASTLIKEEKVIDNNNDNYQPKISPDGKEIAFIENRRSLKIYNIESKQIREILGPDELFYMRDGDQRFSWSPDSQWLLTQYSPNLGIAEIVLIDVNGKQPMVNLTESGFGDYSAKWVNDGKQILWFSDRHGLRGHATSSSRQLDVYSLFLTRDSWDKFNMTEDDYKLWKEIEKLDKDKNKDKEEDSDKKSRKKKKEDKNKEETTKIEIDWEGLKDRKKRLTIHSSRLSDAVLSKDGETLYYLARFEKGLNLWSTNLRNNETKMLIPLNKRSASLEWSKDMDKLFMLSNGSISTVDVKSKSAKPVSISGEVSINLAEERQLMFDHVWKRNKAMFYVSDYHGAPWDKLRDEYKPKLPLMGNDFEFTELLSEMLGELNVSHSGARYRGSIKNSTSTASLGIFIDYSHEDEGVKIAEIMQFGPLDKAHIEVKPNMIIKSIDGEAITHDVDFSKFLNKKADKFTALEIYDPAKGSTFSITIKPITLRQESSLLYNRWVKQNEKLVDSLSNGQLGYVHIPGMSDEPYRNTYEKAMGKYAHTKGLVIDTRFNGGGDLVSDLAMFLTGQNFLEYAIENRSLGIEPLARWTKPSVALVNEANYSDGHCFSCGYKDLGIGTLIGMPVPGTCSFAGWEMLQNGKVLWGSVPVGVKNMKGEWLENYESVPDIVVKNMPGEIDKGRDEQLEVAIKELLNKI
ncbi:MAG: S41 family peptidase [Tenuifilaceae bacterium]|nr:S41 family peptidase [Tenuifilaceae bacterium]